MIQQSDESRQQPDLPYHLPTYCGSLFSAHHSHSNNYSIRKCSEKAHNCLRGDNDSSENAHTTSSRASRNINGDSSGIPALASRQQANASLRSAASGALGLCQVMPSSGLASHTCWVCRSPPVTRFPTTRRAGVTTIGDSCSSRRTCKYERERAQECSEVHLQLF